MITLEGAYTAMVTPFADGTINESKLRETVDFQIENGISGLVPCGTTGESPTLTHDEHHRVIDIVIDAAEGRVPVIAGAGSNNTAEAISLTSHAAEAGADAALLITPYYNKPRQNGLVEHYRTVAQNCNIPLIVYNCPSRTGINTDVETIITLSKEPNIAGIKEASGNMDQICDIILGTDSDFTLLSGDDSMTLPMISVGAKGVISVTANVLPAKMSAMIKAALSGDFAAAFEIHRELFSLMRNLMKVETNPSPVKTAMNMLGMGMGELRLPMTPPDDQGTEVLRKSLNRLGLL